MIEGSVPAHWFQWFIVMVKRATIGIADGKFQVGVSCQRKLHAIVIASKCSQAAIGLLQVRQRVRTGLPVSGSTGQMQVAAGTVFPVAGDPMGIIGQGR